MISRSGNFSKEITLFYFNIIYFEQSSFEFLLLGMQKKAIIIIVGFIALLGMAVFGYVIFSKKKIVNIAVHNSVESIQQTEDNVQQAIDDEQQIVTNNKQKTEDTNKIPVINNEESTDNKQVGETKFSGGKIVDKFVSWGFQKASGRKVDTIIIHSTYDVLGKDPYSIAGIIAEYKQYGVSPHYLIARDGTTYHLVADKNIAYHAGVSKMPDGRTNVNDFSIGIEMANTTEEKFTNGQYAALNRLIVDLKKQYSIKYILGHDDIAPGRKTDPWNIEWNKVDK